MKIAIPTNDGLMLCNGSQQAKGFLILTLELGQIVREEMIWNNVNDNLFPTEKFPAAVRDCQAVMIMDNTPLFTGPLPGPPKEIILTKESIITNACMHYMENTLRKEANTCCCP